MCREGNCFLNCCSRPTSKTVNEDRNRTSLLLPDKFMLLDIRDLFQQVLPACLEEQNDLSTNDGLTCYNFLAEGWRLVSFLKTLVLHVSHILLRVPPNLLSQYHVCVPFWERVTNYVHPVLANTPLSCNLMWCESSLIE